MIKAVLFDLDGTLVDTLDDLADSTNYALATHGQPIHETEKYKYFIGAGMKKLIENVLSEENCTAEMQEKVFKTFFDYYKVHFADKTYPYEGIKEVLESLKERGFKIAVISNKAHEMTTEVTYKIFGDAFDIVCGKMEEYPTKPDPTLSLKIIKDLGVEPAECVFIGDSGSDAVTAGNIGCECIGALWGFRDEKELRENGARYVALKPIDILNVLKEIDNGI